jgi:hypothetical protein
MGRKEHLLRRKIIAEVAAGRPFSAHPNRPAADSPLVVDGRVIGDLVDLVRKQSKPIVSLSGLRIVGDIELAHLEWRGRLNLTNCLIERTVNLEYASIDGVVNLSDSEIGSIRAYYTTVTGSFHASRSIVRNGFRGLGMQVTGSLSLRQADLSAPPELRNVAALDIYRASVGDLYLTGAELKGGLYAVGVTVTRSVRLQGTRITSRGQLTLEQGLDAGDGLDFTSAKIGSTVKLSATDTYPAMALLGSASFRNAQCATFGVEIDHLERLHIDVVGFQFQRLGREVLVTDFLAKLGRDSLAVEPYLHLARLDSSRADLELRRKILVSLQKRVTHSLPSWSGVRWRRKAFEVFAEYGFSPGRSLGWLLLCAAALVVGLRFSGSFLRLKTDPAQGIDSWSESATFALESLLPFASLGAAGLWVAQPSNVGEWFSLGVYLLLKMTSWALAILAVASVTGIVRRE